MAMDAPIGYDQNPKREDPAGDSGGNTGGNNGGNGGGITVTNEPAVTPADEMNDIFLNLGKDYKRAADDENKTYKQSIGNINKQRNANDAQYLMKYNQLNMQSEWQPQQQREQSTYANLRRTMGNAAYGSGLQDLNEGMARYDDMSDRELLDTYKQNSDAAYSDWYGATNDLVSDYNEQVASHNSNMRQLYNSYREAIEKADAQIGADINRSDYDKNLKNSTKGVTKNTTKLDKQQSNYIALQFMRNQQARNTFGNYIDKYANQLNRVFNSTGLNVNKKTSLKEINDAIAKLSKNNKLKTKNKTLINVLNKIAKQAKVIKNTKKYTKTYKKTSAELRGKPVVKLDGKKYNLSKPKQMEKYKTQLSKNTGKKVTTGQALRKAGKATTKAINKTKQELKKNKDLLNTTKNQKFSRDNKGEKYEINPVEPIGTLKTKGLISQPVLSSNPNLPISQNGYIRPNNAVSKAQNVRNTGTVDTSGAAYSKNAARGWMQDDLTGYNVRR